MSSRIKFRASIRDPDKDIRLAGVIYKLERSSIDAAINGFGAAEFHDRDSLGAFCAMPRFPHRYPLAGELPNLLTRGDGHVGEESFPLNATFGDAEHEG